MLIFTSVIDNNMTLLEAISVRHSVRSYIDRPIAADVAQALQHEIESINSETGLHIRLILDEPRAFSSKEVFSTYGKFSGCSNYLVMAGKPSSTFDETVGYYGERLVLLAQTLGLNSCWVGLTYKKMPELYSLEDGDKVACVIALGYGATQGQQHKMKDITEISNVTESSPEWFKAGVEAVLLAPSAVNQQKWYFELQDDQKTVKASAKFSLIGYTKMDLGIAKLHFDLGAKLK